MSVVPGRLVGESCRSTCAGPVLGGRTRRSAPAAGDSVDPTAGQNKAFSVIYFTKSYGVLERKVQKKLLLTLNFRL